MEKLIISGYVGQDATVKNFNGNDYTSFQIAVDKSYKKADGTKIERTNWYNVLKAGAGLAPHVKKGTYLTIIGEPSHKIYRDQNGQDRISLNLNANDISFGGGRSQNQGPQSVSASSANTQTHPHPSMTNTASQSSGEVIDMTGEQVEDDLPF